MEREDCREHVTAESTQRENSGGDYTAGGAPLKAGPTLKY